MHDIAILTCFYNPQRYQRLIDNYHRFRESLGHPLQTIELVFGDHEPQIGFALHVRGTQANVMWQKERLLNILIERLPESVTKVAWVDADLIFENSDWLAEASAKLETHAAVQLFERVHDLDANGDVIVTKEGYAYGRGSQDTTWRRPGGGWAARRDALPLGLDDQHILGSSDGLMLNAWEGKFWNYLSQKMNRGWRQAYLRYAAAAYRAVQGNIGHVTGDCRHLFHGTNANRRYVARNAWLIDNDFDPTTDIAIDENGLWRWSSDKPEMHRLVADYFRLRDEDG